MQSGIDSSRLRIASSDATNAGITKIDIRPDKQQSFFSTAEGPSFRDVLDAVNPLNHIPIVSDLMEQATGHHVSTASKLVGGTLLGGPIGFVASLATAIFEGESGGKSPVMVAYNAVAGDSDTAVASATPATPKELMATAAPVAPVETQQLASLVPAASTMRDAARDATISSKDKAVLDLYGSSTSAHDSYKKAQLLPYLRDVNASRVL